MKMTLAQEIKNTSLIKIRETKDINEIKKILDENLYIPDNRLKTKIIGEIIKYLNLKFSDDYYKIKFLIAYKNSQIYGFVICQIDPHYTSYSRKCGTFGWLHVINFEACKRLIKECELFIKENKVRKLRGNINFPKGLGGIGIQVSGFKEQLLYGVAFNNPNSKLINYLEKLDYIKESEYTCLTVNTKFWNSGKKINKNIKFRYFNLKKIEALKDEILDMGKKSFHSILPDSVSGEERFYEILDIYSQVPDSHYKLNNDFNPSNYTNIPEFIEAWETCNLEKVITWLHMAFDKKTNELVGIIFCLPDLYQLWLGEPITRSNVDTVMIKKEYAGKGLFSSLNNIGQLTCNINGVDYFEGTSIWSNNQRAVNAIFPHGKPIRTHYVYQKKLYTKR